MATLECIMFKLKPLPCIALNLLLRERLDDSNGKEVGI